jgi:cell division protein FtsI (penicillin-binding protein 3)
MSKDTKNFLYYRAYLIYFGFVIIMLVVLYKTVSLQLEGRKNIFTSSDEKIPVRTVSRIPRMGDILDHNLTPLVTSVTYYDVRMDATVVDQKLFDEEVSELAQGLSKMYPEKTAREYENSIRNARSTGNRYLLIQKNVTNEERKMIRKLPIYREGRMKGGLIDTEEIIKRQFPNGSLLRRTLGYYKNDGGKELKVGIEGAFYNYLKGEEGKEIEHRISTGWKKTGQITKEAVEGADVISTLDKEIQEFAHSELEKQLRDMKAEHGCVIVMDVKTGYVRAIANLDRTEEGKFNEGYNHAIGTKEVPGSTFKLASLMAALEDGKINIMDKVDAVGSYVFKGKTFTDSNHGIGYGRITIKHAFEKSSNVITQIIHRAYRNEPEQFLKRIEQFGLTEPLGIDLEGEPSPNVPRPGNPGWWALSIPMMSIGYDFQQTPLQTLAFYNAVANNGKLVRPLFVEEIRRSGQTIKKFEPVVLRDKICSQSTLDDMKACLKGVMTDGTGAALKSIEFKIAGKTGTAKLVGDNKLYNDEKNSTYQASFVGYFPADDPIYSCIVVISKPKVAYYGAAVSGTVFAAIANKVYASTLKYHDAINEKKQRSNQAPIIKTGNKKDITAVLKKLQVRYQLNYEGDWLQADTVKGSVHLNRTSIPKNQVPKVFGMTAKDAIYLLESRGLIVKIKGYGKVVSQSILAGTEITKGQLIKIQLQ